MYQTTRQVSLFIDSLHIPGDEDEAELVVEEADEGVERHIDGVVSEGLQGGPGTYDIRTLKGAFKKGGIGSCMKAIL